MWPPVGTLVAEAGFLATFGILRLDVVAGHPYLQADWFPQPLRSSL